MIKRLIWTIWTPMSSVLKKADKLNLSLSLSLLFSTKPLPEPIPVYCQLDSWEKVSGKFEFEFYYFHSIKCIWKCRLPKRRPFCPRWDELIRLRKCTSLIDAFQVISFYCIKQFYNLFMEFENSLSVIGCKYLLDVNIFLTYWGQESHICVNKNYPLLVQMMACRLIATKPISESTLE